MPLRTVYSVLPYYNGTVLVYTCMYSYVDVDKFDPGVFELRNWSLQAHRSHSGGTSGEVSLSAFRAIIHHRNSAS